MRVVVPLRLRDADRVRAWPPRSQQQRTVQRYKHVVALDVPVHASRRMKMCNASQDRPGDGLDVVLAKMLVIFNEVGEFAAGHELHDDPHMRWR